MSAADLTNLLDFAPADELLPALLDLSVAGVIYYLPVTDDAGEVIDLRLAYLNPAAQQRLGLPPRPTGTYRQLFPPTTEPGVWDLHRAALQSAEPSRWDFHYQADGHDSYFRAAARRLGPGLLVSFTDVNQKDRSLVENALHESQRREQQARAEAERQRLEIQQVFEQAPVGIAILQGPEHRLMLVNQLQGELLSRPSAEVLGRPLFESFPEAEAEFGPLLADIQRTGQAVQLQEFPVTRPRAQVGRPDLGYFSATYHPLHDEQGRVSGIMAVTVEVTEQVQARQRMQALNDELEVRVRERTAQLEAALRQAELQRAQLDAQQGLLSRILSQVPAAIATLSGPEHRYTFVNAPYQALVGGRAELGASVLDVLPELAAQGFGRRLAEVYSSGRPFVGTELPLVLPDASGAPARRYVNVTYQPLLDEQARPHGILAFIVDVTGQVRARQQVEALQAELLAASRRQLQEREDLYQVFEQTPAAVLLLRGPAHRIEYLNPACERLFPGRQMRGLTIAESQPEAAAQGFVDLLDRVYRTGTTYYGNELPLDIDQPDGSTRTHYFNFTYQAYRERGEVVGICVFTYDVTEQVLLRQRQREQQQELQRLFEQAPLAIAIMRGPELVVELANAAVGTIWGRSPAEVLGRPYFEAMPETAGQGFEEILGGVLATGQPFFVTEAPVRLARIVDGQSVQDYVNFGFHPLRDEHDHVTGLIAIGMEVTEQVRARQQVQALNDELQVSNARLTRSNADLDTFVYTASHDLKAPITNIEGLLQALEDEVPTQQWSDTAGHILVLMRDAVERFSTTLAHLSEVARLEQDLEPAAPVNVAGVIEGVRLDLAPLLAVAQADVQLEVDTCPTLHVPAKTLRSAVYNLLSNAIKYRAPDRPLRIRVGCRVEEQAAVLEVQDNGLGIDLVRHPEIFGLFRRYHTHVEGAGVGLYMLKRMVEHLGGRIEVRSHVGVGSTFTVYFPQTLEPA